MMSGEDSDFECVRCGSSDRSPLGKAPFPTDLGRRVAREVCRGCWEEWKDRQMLLINHYGLNLRETRARDFLLENMEAFLFRDGEGGAEIDTSREGTVDSGGV